MQKILMRRKSELESQLVRARGTDFANAKTDVVSIGTIVNVTDVEHNQAEHFTILGAWDSNPDQGVISYLTPVAQSLIGHKPGEEVEVQSDSEKKRYRIDAIAAYRIAEAPASQAPAEQPATA
jgi:transcription elongation GreA/GreB family factor